MTIEKIIEFGDQSVLVDKKNAPLRLLVQSICVSVTNTILSPWSPTHSRNFNLTLNPINPNRYLGYQNIN